MTPQLSIRLTTLPKAAAMAALAATTAIAGPDDNSINLVWEREQTTLDAYYFTDHTGLTLIKNVYDTLVDRDPETGEYLPLLATEWDWESETSLVMKLREGVKFHNGEDFNADDVVHTLNYVTDPANKILLLQMVNWIEGAEKIDDYTVRINLKEPFPAALEYLSLGVPIYPNEYYSEVGTEGMGMNPVGTGPYRIASFEPGREYVLERFADYFEGGSKAPAQVQTVRVKTQKDTNLQIGQLMTGEADFLWRLSPDQADQLESMGRHRIERTPTMRISFLAFNVHDEDSPFSNAKVRQAVSHAIDRDLIATKLVGGGSQKLETVCATQQVACPSPNVTYDYDPEKARALLAEAGYPDGFSTSVAGTSFRSITEAVIGDLQQIGIRANLDSYVWAAFREKWVNDNLEFFHSGTGFWGLGDASIAFGTYFNDMPQDLSNDPKVNELLTEATLSYDLEERTKLYAQAQDTILENAYWVPLVNHVVNFAFAPGLSFQPQMDEINRFYEAHWE